MSAPLARLRAPWRQRVGALALAACVAAGAAAAAAPPDKLAPTLRERMRGLGESEQLAISVTLTPRDLPPTWRTAERRAAIRAQQQSVIDSLSGRGFQTGRRYENLAGFSGMATRQAVERLEAHPEVTGVYLDGRVHASLAQGRALVGADAAHAAGFTGTGVNVALLDTGVDTDHPDLADDLVAQQCFCRGSPSPMSGCCPNGLDTQSGVGSAEDDEGHGTNVAGLITSAGAAASIGVAPDAGLIALKVLGADGSGSFSDVAAALDWLLTNRLALGLRVVNLSLGDGVQYSNPLASPCTGSNTATAIRDLDLAGVAVFVASGNEGFDAGISFPACVPEAISVGGVYDDSVGSVSWCGSTCSEILCTDSPTYADRFVCHSNSATSLDLLAPEWRARTSAMGGSFANFGGTSAAAPYASAVAALLVEQVPARGSADLRTLMKGNGPMVTNPDNGLSFRRTDVSALFAVCGNGALEVGEDCDDGNVVGGDCCSAGCQFEAAASSCEDGDACSVGDQCDGAGGCTPGASATCDDGLFCNGPESCDSVLGCLAGVAPLDDGVACTLDACDEDLDSVTHVADDGLCDDALFCNGPESCDSAVGCLAGVAPLLSDGVACTLDACDEDLDAVTHVPQDGPCDDGAFCNGPEICDVALGCLTGVAPTLDDGVACTLDACNEDLDAVTHVPQDGPCDDGLFCNGPESCDSAVGCLAGVSPLLSDGVACTLDVCNEELDTIAHDPDDGLCDDADPCTADVCDSQAGCSSTPVPGCGSSLTGLPGLSGAGRVVAVLTLLGIAVGTLGARTGRRGQRV